MTDENTTDKKPPEKPWAEKTPDEKMQEARAEAEASGFEAGETVTDVKGHVVIDALATEAAVFSTEGGTVKGLVLDFRGRVNDPEKEVDDFDEVEGTWIMDPSLVAALMADLSVKAVAFGPEFALRLQHEMAQAMAERAAAPEVDDALRELGGENGPVIH